MSTARPARVAYRGSRPAPHRGSARGTRPDPVRTSGRGVARGFTLIEVVVALVIVALGMSALLETLGSAADTAGYLRDKTLAQWIAFNQLTLTRLSGRLPPTGQTTGELDFAGRHWRWQQTVQQASDLGLPFTGVVRIDVQVQPADTPAVQNTNWMATVTGAMGDAVASAQLTSLYSEPGQPVGSSQPAASSQPASSSPLPAAQPVTAPVEPAPAPAPVPAPADSP